MHFRKNWQIFLGNWGEAELILRIWGAKKNTFRELRNFLSGIWRDQWIFFRDQGPQTTPLGASYICCLLTVSDCQPRKTTCKLRETICSHWKVASYNGVEFVTVYRRIYGHKYVVI